jgi:hypothetical protein
MYKEQIELHIAHQWDCDECGVENFERCVSVEAKTLNEEALKKLGTQDFHSLHVYPATVQCKNCKSCYKTEDSKSVAFIYDVSEDEKSTIIKKQKRDISKNDKNLSASRDEQRKLTNKILRQSKLLKKIKKCEACKKVMDSTKDIHEPPF